MTGLLAAGLAARSPARLPALAAVVGLVGWLDDTHGTAHARGLRGHLRALQAGEVTTGLLKLIGIAAASLAFAPRGRPLARRVVDGGCIAVWANLVNLFDLRPGRALKVAGSVVLPLACSAGDQGAAAAGVLGAVAVAGRIDLREQGMLGDCGANALGAVAGWLWADRGGAGEWALLTAGLLLTLASEQVSFSAVIDATPPLRRIDRLGRRA